MILACLYTINLASFIDYTKNKFRSLLILTQYPNDFNEIPSLNTPNFNFLVLKPNDSIEKYIDDNYVDDRAESREFRLLYEEADINYSASASKLNKIVKKFRLKL